MGLYKLMQSSLIYSSTCQAQALMYDCGSSEAHVHNPSDKTVGAFVRLFLLWKQTLVVFGMHAIGFFYIGLHPSFHTKPAKKNTQIHEEAPLCLGVYITAPQKH